MRVATQNRIYRFGRFTFDPHLRRLTRGARVVALHDRSMDVLVVLLDHAGEFVSKRLGYRLLVTESSSAASSSADTADADLSADFSPDFSPHFSIDELLEPHRAFITGLAAIETLGRDAVARAHDAFAEALRLCPDDAASHAEQTRVNERCFSVVMWESPGSFTRLLSGHLSVLGSIVLNCVQSSSECTSRSTRSTSGQTVTG